MNSSNIKIVLESITDLQFSRAHIVDEYRSASKLINDALGCRTEKKVGRVSSNLPLIKLPPSILGIEPKAE